MREKPYRRNLHDSATIDGLPLTTRAYNALCNCAQDNGWPHPPCGSQTCSS